MNPQEMYDLCWMGVAAVSSMGVCLVGIKILSEGIYCTLNARQAIEMIDAGDNPLKYRWVIDDARIDPISRLIVGGKTLDNLANEIEPKIRTS
ncbi:MAG: hypothetical protein WCP89_01270 [archaeon]